MNGAAKSDLIDVELHLHHQTEKAILVSADGVREGAVWLAKSLIEIEVLYEGYILVTLSERLAIERGLV